MKNNTYIQAKLIAWDRIRVGIFSDVPWSKLDASLLIGDAKEPLPLTLIKNSTLGPYAVVEYQLPKPMRLGEHYRLFTPGFGILPIDVSDAPFFPGFDEAFTYEGNDLGAVYSKKATTFRVWAPLASVVYLKIRLPKHSMFTLFEMKREEKGVYALGLEGDYDGCEYRYVVCNSEAMSETSDPYAKASGPNGKSSYVLDFSSFNDIKTHEEALPRFESLTDVIVYEAHVRDLTISSHTDILHKGKFLGMIEKGRKSDQGLPAGFDYLTSLGFTHLQLLPIYDYQTVDELHPDEKYNWGYDPAQYFVPEGSYASNVLDPRSRVAECKKMISAFHEAGIRIVMDVVFNHVYEARRSVFDAIVPNYYFRKNADGRRANTSGCGNDLASERPMVRKLILDACAWWQDFYHVDGFRFDLMGIIDVKTVQQIEKRAKAKDPSFVVYGEGWNMGGQVKEPLAHSGNHALLPGFGFFNDTYREAAKGFWAGNFDCLRDYEFSIVSSSLPFHRGPLFLDARQTVNYIECHDNATYFDVLSARRKDLDEGKKCELVLASSAAILLSFGIPFLHMGQEIAASKFNEENTYNLGDHYNKFSYPLLAERKEMVEILSHFIEFRKKMRFLHVYDPKVIDESVFISDHDGCIHLSVLNPTLIAPYQYLEMFFNPTDHEIRFTLKVPQRVLLCTRPAAKGEKGDVIVPARSTLVTGR